MTDDHLILLSQGRIPAELILPRVIERLEIRDRSRAGDEPHALTILCEKRGLNYPTIVRTIYRFQHPECADGMIKSLDFNTADELLCGVNLYDLWTTELREYYERVDLTWRKCECPGCETWFRPNVDKLGRPRSNQKYCSRPCRDSAENQAKGRTTIRRKRANRKGYCWKGHKITPENSRKTNKGMICRICDNERKRAREARIREGVCKNGHPRTPENTYVRPNGKCECILCRREGNKRTYHERRTLTKAA